MARLQGEEVMYVYVRIRIGGVIVSGWLTHGYMVMFERKNGEPIEVRSFLMGTDQDNPVKLNRATTFNWYDFAKLAMRLEMTEERDSKKEEITVLELKTWDYNEARKEARPDNSEDDGDE